MKIKFDVSDFKNGDLIIKCQTEQSFRECLSKLEELGLLKNNDLPFFHWKDYHEDTCVLYDGEVLYGCYNDCDVMEEIDIALYEDIDFVIKRDNAIPELKNGMIVELRDNELLIVTTSYYFEDTFLMGKTSWDEVGNYDKNLKNVIDTELDIIAVYKPADGYEHCTVNTFLDNSKKYLDLVWKREAPKKMTLSEISEVLGYEVEIV